MKRIVSVQDISCLGKCSLTVVLPVVSAMGVECSVLPTAVLSTHTLFSGVHKRDLTEDIAPILDHWAEEDFRFDGIYIGYLGSVEQVDLMADMVRRFRREDNFVLVDPVMGDNGRLYTGFTPEFAARMTGLCAVADVIVPNLTEACCMLGMEYPAEYDRAFVQLLLKKLTALGARCAMITGLSFEENTIGVMGYDSRSGEFFAYCNEKAPHSYHGTGDLFTGALAGGLSRGLSMAKAVALAADFVRECILQTAAHPQEPARGVQFERAMGWLVKRLEEEGL